MPIPYPNRCMCPRSLLLILFLFTAAMAVNRIGVVPCVAPDDTIHIDGEPLEGAWGDTAFYLSGANLVQGGYEQLDSPSDLSVRVWLRWDSLSLYVGWDVVDDDYVMDLDIAHVFLCPDYRTVISDSEWPFYGENAAIAWLTANSQFAKTETGTFLNLDSLGIFPNSPWSFGECRIDAQKFYGRKLRVGDTISFDFGFYDEDLGSRSGPSFIAWSQQAVNSPLNDGGLLILAGPEVQPGVAGSAALPTAPQLTLLPLRTAPGVMRLQVSARSSEAFDLAVFDLLGRKVLTQQGQLYPGMQMIDVKNPKLGRGVYFVALATKAARVSRRIVKF